MIAPSAEKIIIIIIIGIAIPIMIERKSPRKKPIGSPKKVTKITAPSANSLSMAAP
ncbi:hypothetical protein PBI_SCTP2_280 [Salicola phage SCTP-2]|nr:hypothetical protein PBI_SCTP2_280 [Salicola phage SCTP-2]